MFRSTCTLLVLRANQRYLPVTFTLAINGMFNETLQGGDVYLTPAQYERKLSTKCCFLVHELKQIHRNGFSSFQAFHYFF